jgi:hypothetical protein
VKTGVAAIPVALQFVGDGQQIVVAFSFPHALPFDHRDLLDMVTGDCPGSIKIDNNIHKPPTDAPAWAK